MRRHFQVRYSSLLFGVFGSLDSHQRQLRCFRRFSVIGHAPCLGKVSHHVGQLRQRHIVVFVRVKLVKQCIYLWERCSRDQHLHTSAKLALRNQAVLVLVPLVEQFHERISLPVERILPIAYAIDFKLLFVEPFLPLQAKGHEHLLYKGKDVESKRDHHEPSQPCAVILIGGRQFAAERNVVLKDDHDRDDAQRDTGGSRLGVDQEAKPRDADHYRRLHQVIEQERSGLPCER
mmetsp:Transcript_9908/g.23676  ORF Transcript_9908/g.23676 Transcript_9908/m.23676 type:complete len:233 (-) Transcript_9908:121-819(-)